MKKLDKVIQIFLALVVFLLPLVIVPLFTDIHEFGKLVFICLALFAGFVLWVAKFIVERKITFGKSLFLLPLTAIFVLTVISGLVNAPNKIQSMISLGGGATFFFLLLTYLYLMNLGKVEAVVTALLAGGTVMSLMTIVLSSGILKLPLNYPSLNLSVTEPFSLIGNLLSQTVWLVCIVPLGMAMAYENLLKKKNVTAVVFFAVSVACLAGIGLGMNLLASTAKPIIPSKVISWSVAMEGLKNSRFAFLGVGPGQYINAFTTFKPVGFNDTLYWNLRFGYAAWFFQILTEIGIVGLILYLLLGWKVAKNFLGTVRQAKPSPLALAVGVGLLILLVCQFYFPMNFSLLFLFFVMLALYDLLIGNDEKKSLDLSPLGQTVYLFLIFPAILWGAILFFGAKTAFANYHYLNSLKAVAANDGTKAYQLQIKAIETDPDVALYHIAYANTNFALANALATKPDLTDNDRNTISQLIQQAIREAKSAVSLDNNSAYAWENLSGLYRNLINFAEGADQWAIASYQEAIKRDPLNPGLRLDLGGIYFGQKNFSLAANMFNQVVSLKPDFANGYYNLANALKELGALQEAKSAYEMTQSLVVLDSNDYQKVTTELEEVKRRLPTPTPAAQLTPETLSKPQPPAEGINPPLEIPNETPPVSPETTPVETP